MLMYEEINISILIRWASDQRAPSHKGIDKSNIRHVIRNGVPESVISWTQEFGRAGRDGLPSTATILYRKSDLRHANAWIWNNVSNPQKCESILSDFSTSWRFVEAHFSRLL